MELKTLQGEMRKLSEIVGGWNTPADISEIERELALEKLRMLYDALRFCEVRVSAVSETAEDAPEDIAVSIDLGEVLSLDPLFADEAEMVVEAAVEPVLVSEPEDVRVADPDTESSFAELTPTPEPEVLRPAAEQPRQMEPEPVATPQTLFGIEAEDTARHRHKQRVIMSLYDNAEQTPKPVPAPQPIKEIFTELPVEVVSVIDPDETVEEQILASEYGAGAVADPAMEPKTVAKPELEISADGDDDEFILEEVTIAPGAVLGEVINPNMQTLADRLAPQHTVALEIRPEPVSDLRRAIGINDKFLMIRDLFDNDAEAFDAAVGMLNDFDNLDDCMIHIAENYSWNPNSDGAKLLVELLERKFA